MKHTQKSFASPSKNTVDEERMKKKYEGKQYLVRKKISISLTAMR